MMQSLTFILQICCRVLTKLKHAVFGLYRCALKNGRVWGPKSYTECLHCCRHHFLLIDWLPVKNTLVYRICQNTIMTKNLSKNPSETDNRLAGLINIYQDCYRVCRLQECDMLDSIHLLPPTNSQFTCTKMRIWKKKQVLMRT